MDRLVALQLAIEALAAEGGDATFADRLCVTRVGDLAYLDFYGDPFGESFPGLLDALSDSSVARLVASIDLRGPDEVQMAHETGTLARLLKARRPFQTCAVFPSSKPSQATTTGRSWVAPSMKRECWPRFSASA